jgi:hypothetical protein
MLLVDLTGRGQLLAVSSYEMQFPPAVLHTPCFAAYPIHHPNYDMVASMIQNELKGPEYDVQLVHSYLRADNYKGP